MADRPSDQEGNGLDVPEKIGPYQVKGSLGRGGMGEVYRGYDDRLARPVALKRVLTGVTADDRLRRRFRREAQTVAQLSHASIVQVYDWVETEQDDWLVMELIDGKPLSEYVTEDVLTVERAVDIAIGIAGGLAAAHDAGIVHRDLKLSNVMVAKGGVKILDFGIAKPIQAGEIGQTDITREGAVVGTVASMSPEQAQGLPVDHRSDLFSFGTLLYKLLTGLSPFRGRDLMQTVIRIYSLAQVPVIDLNPDVPERLSDLVEHLLAKNPDHRPADAHTVFEELQLIAAELRDESLSGSSSRPLFTTASLEATLAGGAPTPMPPGSTDTGSTRPRSTGAQTGGSRATWSPRIDDLASGVSGVGTGTIFDRTKPSRRWIGLVVLVLLVGLVSWGVYRMRPSDSATPAEGMETDLAADALTKLRADRIVVLPFDNRTGKADEFDSLGLIIADWLTQGLSRGGRIEVVPTDVAVRAARLVAGDEDGPIGLADLTVVAEDTGARTVIVGAYYLRQGELILHAQIADAVEETVITGLEPLTTPADDPIGVLDDLEQSVRASVATYLDPQLTTYGNLFSSPPTYEAYEAYVRGMEHFWSLDFPSAIESFEVAGELAPSFAMPRLMAATSHINLGQLEAMEPILEKLHEERDELAPVDRLFLDWLRAVAAGDYPRSAQIAGQVASLAPLSGWPQTRGVDSLKANMPHQALEALAPLDTEQGFLRGWVPHFEYLTFAYHLTGDHDGELQAARKGRELYPESIICLTAEARALVALGQTDEAMDLIEKSHGLSQQYLHSRGMVMTLIASELRVHGHEKEGLELMKEVVAWYEGREDDASQAVLEHRLHVLALLALDRADEALDIARTRHEAIPESLESKGLVGVAAAAAGERGASETQLAALREIGEPYLFGRDDYWRAAIRAWQGNREQAVAIYRQVVDGGHPFVWPRLHPHFDPIWHPLRGYEPFADAIRPRG